MPFTASLLYSMKKGKPLDTNLPFQSAAYYSQLLNAIPPPPTVPFPTSSHVTGRGLRSEFICSDKCGTHFKVPNTFSKIM